MGCKLGRGNREGNICRLVGVIQLRLAAVQRRKECVTQHKPPERRKERDRDGERQREKSKKKGESERNL